MDEISDYLLMQTIASTGALKTTFAVNTHSSPVIFFPPLSCFDSLSLFLPLMSLKLFMCCGSHLIYSVRHLEQRSAQTPVFNSDNRQKHLIVSHNQTLFPPPPPSLPLIDSQAICLNRRKKLSYL